MANPSFVYVTYIATTPEKVWQAVVDADITRKYWINPVGGDPGHVNISDWKPGSRFEHQRMDQARSVDIVGKIVESDPPRRLVFTWARPKDAADAALHSTVTFDIEAQTERLVRLTVTHDGLENDPKMLAGISGGWPMVLSNMKTFLESGQALGPAQPGP